MSKWEPTMRLRRILREHKTGEGTEWDEVIQQQWRRLVSGVDEHGAYWDEKTEWRDVPLVREGEE